MYENDKDAGRPERRYADAGIATRDKQGELTERMDSNLRRVDGLRNRLGALVGRVTNGPPRENSSADGAVLRPGPHLARDTGRLASQLDECETLVNELEQAL